MPTRTSKTGSELFIVDNSDTDWKVLRYLRDWCPISKAIDIATGYFEIGSLLALGDEWKSVEKIRILLGDEVSLRTKAAFAAGLTNVTDRLDTSLESEKQKNDFLAGVPAIVAAIQSGQITCRVYRKDKFHAKAYLTHARLEVVGSSALVGSSNFTYPGLTENIELNIQITGGQVKVLQEWYEDHWNAAEDVTLEMLRTIERHTRDYTPFEVYARALQELHRRVELPDEQWFERGSKVYHRLDKYQQDGFKHLVKIGKAHGGALLCDGVGLGKTFVGLMLLEYLIERKRKRVVLIVPKAGRYAVWEKAITEYAPHLKGVYSGLRIYNQTDLGRGLSADRDFPAEFRELTEKADVVVIDEAHHFRNRGHAGTGERIPSTGTRALSRYFRLYNLIGDTKQVYLLTATPVNNRLTDIQHLLELFSRNKADHFKSIGINSLPGHIRKLDKALNADPAAELDTRAVGEVLKKDVLFETLIVQRSRTFVRESQRLHGGKQTVFPEREPPKVAGYNARKTYGKLLKMVEDAFEKEKPLFALAIYNPYDYWKEGVAKPDEFTVGRAGQIIALIRTQFLKRFESSSYAFEQSCNRMLKKLLAFAERYAVSAAQKRRLDGWLKDHKDIIGYVGQRQLELFPDPDAEEEADEDFITDEMREAVELADEENLNLSEMFADTLADLVQIGAFLEELQKFKVKDDDKLNSLIKLLKTDKVLKSNKVLIFTEFGETARYLKQHLDAAGIAGVAQVDGSSSANARGQIITRFAPYYNGSSSAELGDTEIRVLISTDVLSEGLNLQDATRLINYDLHWNPVRLMQRIGRVDRRLNPDVEKRLVADHPEQKDLRGKVAYWNFLPPEELNSLLSLYAKVTHKTLRISKTFGIEGKKLLHPDDDYEALRDFNKEFEQGQSAAEKLENEYDRLVVADPALPERLAKLPGRVFSGKRHPAAGTTAVFFCYALPGHDPATDTWTEDAGRAAWYLFDLASGKIDDDPTTIADAIRCGPETPRYCTIPQVTLAEVRTKMEAHIKKAYLRSVQAPVGIVPVLKAWMELN